MGEKWRETRDNWLKKKKKVTPMSWQKKMSGYLCDMEHTLVWGLRLESGHSRACVMLVLWNDSRSTGEHHSWAARARPAYSSQALLLSFPFTQHTDTSNTHLCCCKSGMWLPIWGSPVNKGASGVQIKFYILIWGLTQVYSVCKNL